MALCSLLAIFGFGLVWISGHRGLFLLDQSMIFDGAWRLLQGQVPYRDVYYPFGPVTFLIQAGFFKLFGVSFSTTVLAAAVVNAVAGLIVVRIIRQLFPHRRIIALMGGLATICWFQAPFGTLWLEQTAFFFGLAALCVTVEAERHDTNLAVYARLVFGGILLALSILSKQNAGLLMIPIVAGVFLMAHLREPKVVLKRLSMLSA